MSEKPEALEVADAMLLQIEENIALRRENERLRGLLTEARGAKWLVVQDNLLDRINAALRREET